MRKAYRPSESESSCFGANGRHHEGSDSEAPFSRKYPPGLSTVRRALVRRKADLSSGVRPKVTEETPVRLAAAAKLGLDIYPVLRGTPDAELQGNLLLDHLFGAHITFIDATDLYSHLSADTMNAITAELRSKGRKPYVIDMRYATGPLASIGFVAASVGLTRQLAEMDIHPNYLFLSTGSGTTQAGLVLGASLLGLEYEVVGISVQQPTGKMTPRIVEKEYVLAATGCGASSARICSAMSSRMRSIR